MKSYHTILVILSLGVLLLDTGCEQTTSPTSNIDIVPAKEIPRPYSNSIYFLYGYKVDSGEKVIFDQLVSEGFALCDAWVPNEFYGGECGMATISQMIVKLEHSDSRIYSFGFVSDSSQIAAGPCIPSWKHYTFKK